MQIFAEVELKIWNALQLCLYTFIHFLLAIDERDLDAFCSCVLQTLDK